MRCGHDAFQIEQINPGQSQSTYSQLNQELQFLIMIFNGVLLQPSMDTSIIVIINIIIIL